MQVKEVMTRNVELTDPDATLAEAATMMRELDIGPLPVVDAGRLVGFITDRDITVRATSDGRDPNVATVGDVMSRDVVFCFEDEDVKDAARMMESRQIRRLVVLNRSHQLVGLLSLGDLALTTGDEQLAGEVLERVSEPAPAAIEVARGNRRELGPMRTVAGIFPNDVQARRAVEDLRGAGIAADRVSVIARDPDAAREIAGEARAEVVGGTALGGGLGAILGGAAGWLVGIGALVLPGIGPVIAAGPIAAALGIAGTTAAVGAGAGAVGGGLIGALMGWGFSESEARDFESRIEQGEILLAANVNQEMLASAEDILRRDGAERVTSKLAA